MGILAFALLAISLDGAFGGEAWTNLQQDLRSSKVPIRRYAHTASTYKDQLLITHGYLYLGYQNWLNDTWLYTPSTNKWNQVEISGPIPDPRYGHTFEKIDGLYYLFGGDDGTVKTSPTNYIPNPHDDLWVLSVEKKTWTEIEKKVGEPWPPARAAHASFTYNGEMFIFGGYPEQSDLWKFSPATNKWSFLNRDLNEDEKTHPGVRFSVSMIVPAGNENAYLFGGYRRGTRNMNDMWAYHIPSNSWKELNVLDDNGRIPHMRGAYAVAAREGRVFLWAGAECNPMCTCFQDLWAFDPATNKWEEIHGGSELPPPRYKHSLTTMPDGTLLAFGGEGYRFASDYHNDVWQFGPVSYGYFFTIILIVVVISIITFFGRLFLQRRSSKFELPSAHKGR